MGHLFICRSSLKPEVSERALVKSQESNCLTEDGLINVIECFPQVDVNGGHLQFWCDVIDKVSQAVVDCGVYFDVSEMTVI